ncbi:hypothetical protein [Sulfitobacter geojensis]|uniref:hypothetical protein n=1 Tax=Sulfitobacter geojensis TaxID=1342299 RepID=UPI0024939547|nr:hypothetical protein [Sulfitobacter geojensis]
MTGAIPAEWPYGAAFWQRLGRSIMDVILHLGAHRTATTTFQHYMRDHSDDLASKQIAFWGPERVRGSVTPGLFRRSTAPKGRNLAKRAEGRIRLFAAQAKAQGIKQLLVSDENLLGNCKQNIRAERLYPAAGERIARVSAAFGGQVRRIVLTIRAQDLWWASACALTVSRGHPVPSTTRLANIAHSRRNWRDVITDLACAAPGAQIDVLTFEAGAGGCERVLRAALETDVPTDTRKRWLNRSPDLQSLRAALAEQGSDPELLPDTLGRWQPFTAEQTAMLRENYADDLHWLFAGAEGLATLTEDTCPNRAETYLPSGAFTKGQRDDQGQIEGHVAQHR